MLQEPQIEPTFTITMDEPAPVRPRLLKKNPIPEYNWQGRPVSQDAPKKLEKSKEVDRLDQLRHEQGQLFTILGTKTVPSGYVMGAAKIDEEKEIKIRKYAPNFWQAELHREFIDAPLLEQDVARLAKSTNAPLLPTCINFRFSNSLNRNILTFQCRFCRHYRSENSYCANQLKLKKLRTMFEDDSYRPVCVSEKCRAKDENRWKKIRCPDERSKKRQKKADKDMDFD